MRKKIPSFGQKCRLKVTESILGPPVEKEEF
jgi:hypothetical protein